MPASAPSHASTTRPAGGTLRALGRSGVAVLAAAALALPGAARAVNRNFAINSLIIPVQIEYQDDDGIIDAYGLVYSILRRNPERILAGKKPVTFYWSIAPNKLSQYRCNTNTNTLPTYGALNDNDGCDFAIQNAAGSPVALLLPNNSERSPFGTLANEQVYLTSYTPAGGPVRGSTVAVNASRTVMKYLGGAWIVDATNRSDFLEMLADYPEMAQYRTTANTNYVRIHSAKTSFTAPVARLLNQKPPLIAVMNTAGADFLINVLAQAGLGAIQTDWNVAPPNGVVLEKVDPATLLTTTGTYPQGPLNSGRYGLMWAPDAQGAGIALNAAQLANLTYFVDMGFGAYVEANSIDAIENGAKYHTTTGVNAINPNIAYYEDCNDRSLPAGSFYRSTRSGDCFVYGGMSQPYAQTGNFAFEGGQGNYKAYTPLGAFLSGVDQVLKVGTETLTSARYKDNDHSKGLIFYMAGHKFDNTRYWGQRLIMDSVISNVPLVVGVELSRSEPVGYTDTTVSPATKRVYQGTYFQLPDPASRDMEVYNVAAPQRWQFPFTVGHLYEYNLTSISTAATGQSFAANKRWDAADNMPAPGSRNVFTALGGSAHLGWTQVNWRYDQVGSTCANLDGAGNCLLAKALADCGTAGITTNLLLPASDSTATGTDQRNKLGMFVQQVRGYCSSHNPAITGTPRFTPTNNQCDDPRQPNSARLGGVDHGSPAIVGPSRYVTTTDAAHPWDTRPVVAYVGTRDGMLHAIYVSGGANNWTADGKTQGNVAEGTELWAFIPPGQICGVDGQSGLFSNDSMVDASVNVIDVFGNFPEDGNNDGVIDWSTGSLERPTGLNKWRTMLLAAVGQGGSELFALDVTNPLKPVLLWHVSGYTEHDDRWDANGDGDFADAGDHLDPTNPNTYALQWVDSTDPSGLSAQNGVSLVTPALGSSAGRLDYRNLGLTYGTAVGKLWEGNGYRYVAYVATSTADFTDASTPLGYKGVEVFGIDLVTGQKVWQWQRRYARKTSGGVIIADNTIPGRPALADVDVDGSVDRIYVGDIEGHMWELEAHQGGNLNYLESKDSVTTSKKFYSFPLYGTPSMTATTAPAASKDLVTLASGGLAQQPLTSPIGLGRFTQVPVAPASRQTYFPNRLAVLQGSMGVDWDVANYERGNLFILPVYWEQPARLAYWYDTGPQAALDPSGATDPRAFGLLKSDVPWITQLVLGERIFGMPRVVNNEVVFTTAQGSFTGDITDTLGQAGNLYFIKPTGTTSETTGTKSFGGVLVFQDTLVVSTADKIKAKAEPADMQGGGALQKPFNRTTPAIFKTWEPPNFVKRNQ